MKYIWSEEDIVVGIYVCKPHQKHYEKSREVDGWDAKWTLKLGFLPSISTKDGNLCLISMCDGMVSCIGDKEKIVKYLNDSDLIPMPHKRIIEIINYLRRD